MIVFTTENLAAMDKMALSHVYGIYALANSAYGRNFLIMERMYYLMIKR